MNTLFEAQMDMFYPHGDRIHIADWLEISGITDLTSLYYLPKLRSDFEIKVDSGRHYEIHIIVKYDSFGARNQPDLSYAAFTIELSYAYTTANHSPQYTLNPIFYRNEMTYINDIENKDWKSTLADSISWNDKFEMPNDMIRAMVESIGKMINKIIRELK